MGPSQQARPAAAAAKWTKSTRLSCSFNSRAAAAAAAAVLAERADVVVVCRPETCVGDDSSSTHRLVRLRPGFADSEYVSAAAILSAFLQAGAARRYAIFLRTAAVRKMYFVSFFGRIQDPFLCPRR